MGRLSPGALAHLLLLGTVLVWGATFVLVKDALGDVSPLLFNLLRMTLAFGVLVVVNRRELGRISRRGLVAGGVAGVLLATGYQFQTAGLVRTTPSKSAFITGLVVVWVPLFTAIPALRPAGTRATGWAAVVGALLAFAGLLLLTTPAGTAWPELFGTIGVGDLLTLLCAVAFAGHLIALAHSSPGLPAGQLATVQIGVAAVVMAGTLPLEQGLHLVVTGRLVVALAVTSVLATAAAFTIQSWAQKHLPATHTAVILALEPVFAWLTALVCLHERLGARSLAGAGLILAGIALTELMPGLARPASIPV
ncbi:MAG TPA: DMT family transporter [Granulicella sp.]|jgi:drug/metabolite transporter (DMT)-like permease|nr:DMT family transporter [Granulicella sp.]